MQRAFTLIELVFVMVVAGILAAVLMPKLERDTLYEAALQVVTHIRYTQHLAMVDDRFDMLDQYWYKRRWQIRFYQNITFTSRCPTATFPNVWAYSIFSDRPGTSGKSTGNPDKSELARNPQNGSQFLSGGYNNILCVHNENNPANEESMDELRLGEKYDVKDIDMSRSCHTGGANPSQRIAFDHLGRPLRGAFHNYSSAYPANRLIVNQCRITLCSVNDCSTASQSEKVVIAIEPETGYVHLLE